MKCPHCSSDQYSINVTCANCGIIYKALPHWVGLTDDERDYIVRNSLNVALSIEEKLKEKNT